MEIQIDLQEKYLKSFEHLEGQQVHKLYETMVKLNAEMIGQALQRYKDEVK